MLLEAGVTINLPGYVLHRAVDLCEDAIPLLATYVSVEETFSEKTPLEWAIQRSKPKAVELLLQAGANPNNGQRDSPLAASARQGNVTILQMLLEAGADPNQCDSSGECPLLLVITHYNACALRSLLPSVQKQQMIRCLLMHGADTEQLDSQGLTPFVRAASEPESSEIIRLLLSRGAQPEILPTMLQQLSSIDAGRAQTIIACSVHYARARAEIITRIFEQRCNMPRDLICLQHSFLGTASKFIPVAHVSEMSANAEGVRLAV